MREFHGRVAVVTGAGSGIGRALALRLAAEGMNLALADIEGAPLEETRKMAADIGAEVIAQVTDVGAEDSVAAFAERTFAELGEVHLLCNNAGVFMGGIHESERTRPASLGTEPGEDSAFMEEMIATTVERGISPDVVADQVVEAVRSERFLVLTHPAYASGLTEQAEALVAGALPRMPDFEWTG